MAEGFITRRGGVGAERTEAPSINFISKTGTQIVVTFTNNEANEVDVFYGITSSLTDKVTLASTATSSNITFSGLDPNTPYTISAYAIVTNATLKKIKSEIITTSVTTDDVQFISATGGTTTTYTSSGKFYKSHTFLSSGNFVVNSLASTSALNEVDYLIIAGGGGASNGGGGAGGFRTTITPTPGNTTSNSKITANTQTYSITIGAGGNSGTTVASKGLNGANSTALGITSTGGGGGGAGFNNAINDGNNGGSGGGSSGNQSTGGGTPGTGISGQGFAGGLGGHTPGSTWASGGGGGALQVGSNRSGNNGGNGGNGLANTLRTGSSETRAGGGGGNASSGATPGASGAGGGGAGGTNNNSGGNGTANTGGGGGGAESGTSGNGGSGIVIIRYEVGSL
jgi:hypothetical protein